MKRPFVFIGTAMFISTFLLSYLGTSAAMVFSAVGIIVGTTSFFLKNKHKHFRKLLCICISVIIASSLFSLKTAYDYSPALLLCDEKTHSISGTVTDSSESYGSYYYTLDNISLDGNEIRQKIRIKSDVYRNAQTDDTISCSAVRIYTLGSGNRNVHLNYKSDGTYLGAYTYNSELTISKAETHSFLYYIQQIKYYLTDTLYENTDSQTASIITALLVGDDSGIEYDTLLNFRFSGVAHLFAVSGFHLALWTSLISKLMTKYFRKYKRTSAILSIVFILFFIALTGFSKSVIRAGIMLIIMYFGKIIKYKSDSINSLFTALTVILLANPFAATSISLQMSFLSTLGIISFYLPVVSFLQKFREKLPKSIFYIFSFIFTTFAISVIASIFTMPVSALNFGYYSFLSPVTNILCVPASQILMPLSFVAIILSPIPFISDSIFTVCTLLVRYLVSATSAMRELRYSIISTDADNIKLFILILFLAVIFTVIIFFEKAKHIRNAIAVISAITFAFSVSVIAVQKNSYNITVSFVDNGTSVILNTGKSDSIIACGGDNYYSYNLIDSAYKNTSKKFDFLLIPRNTETEASYSEDLLKKFSFVQCIISEDKFSPRITMHLPENTIKTSEQTVLLDENTTLIYINNDNFSGARIESEKLCATILFRPTSDFETVPESWQTGDLLITRQSLPETDISGFDNIIISTSSETSVEETNIFSTKILGNIKYIKTPWGGVRINAVQ